MAGTLLLSLLLVYLGLARAIDLKLIAPSTGNAWEAGQDVVVTWHFDSTASEAAGGNITQIDIDLVKGTPDNLKENISFGVPVSVTSADWQVDSKLEPGDDYMIRITSAEDPRFRLLSPKFVIYGGKQRGQNSAPGNADQESSLFAYIYFLLIPCILLL